MSSPQTSTKTSPLNHAMSLPAKVEPSCGASAASASASTESCPDSSPRRSCSSPSAWRLATPMTRSTVTARFPRAQTVKRPAPFLTAPRASFSRWTDQRPTALDVRLPAARRGPIVVFTLSRRPKPAPARPQSCSLRRDLNHASRQFRTERSGIPAVKTRTKTSASLNLRNAQENSEPARHIDAAGE